MNLHVGVFISAACSCVMSIAVYQSQVFDTPMPCKEICRFAVKLTDELQPWRCMGPMKIPTAHSISRTTADHS